MTSAVLVQGIIPLLGILPYNPTHHCFWSPLWMTERSKDAVRMGVPSKERVCRQTQMPPTCLCFQPWLSWETLTDSSLYTSLLCDSYHTTGAPLLRCSSPLYSVGEKIHIPHLHTDMSLPLPTRLGEKLKWSEWEKKTITSNGGKVHLEMNHCYKQNCSFALLRPRTVNRRHPIAIND